MASLAETKTTTTTSTSIELGEDKFYYINGLKITGVAAIERDTANGMVSICTENRTAHTKAEQKEFGLPQPFLLPPVSMDKFGAKVSENKIAEAFLKKMEKKGKEVKLSPEMQDLQVTNTWHLVEKVVYDAKKRYQQFEHRRFPMVVKREAMKENETPTTGLVRLLKEEFKKRFKEGTSVPEYKFIYPRRSNTCLLVYFIETSDLEWDSDAIKKKGQCTYFCSHSLPEICDNDYLETRDHMMLPTTEADKIIERFSVEMNTLGCDLSRWGGDKFWSECKKHF